MAQEEKDTTGSIDSLFSEGSSEASPGAPGQKVDKELVYQCPRYGEKHVSEQPIAFCSKCGAPIDPARTSATKRVLLVDDAIIARKKMIAILKKPGCQVIEPGMASTRCPRPRKNSPI